MLSVMFAMALGGGALFANADPFQFTNSCLATGGFPTSRFNLPFCGEIHTGRRCCPSQVDLQNRETYVALTATDTATCGPSDPVVLRSMKEIRDFLCLPCDPREPSYRYLQADGDLHLGGQAPPNVESDSDAWGWRVCKSFLFGPQGRSGMWGADGSKFDECGYTASECKNVEFLEYIADNQSWLRHSPGPCEFPNNNGPVFPSKQYEGDELQKAVAVLQDVWSALDGFAFYVLDDFDPSYHFESAPCFGRNGVERVSGSVWTSLAIFVCVVVLGLR